jgi:hypothetical protein
VIDILAAEFNGCARDLTVIGVRLEA